MSLYIGDGDSKHALMRTSPKGQDFVGTCTRCGTTGLTLEDFVRQVCPNLRGVSDSEALIEVVTTLAEKRLRDADE